MNKTRQKWHDEGLCVWCGAVPDRIGMYCSKCNEYHKGHSYNSVKKRDQEKRCISCGKDRDSTGRYCLACKDMFKVKQRELKAYRKANGICVDCAKTADAGVRCRACADKALARTRRNMESKKLTKQIHD